MAYSKCFWSLLCSLLFTTHKNILWILLPIIFCCWHHWITKRKGKGGCVCTQNGSYTCGTVTETTTTHWHNNQHLEDESSVSHTTYDNNGKVLKQEYIWSSSGCNSGNRTYRQRSDKWWQAQTVEDLSLAETPKRSNKVL